MSAAEEDDMILAGEYVLGVLDAAERAGAEDRMRRDTGFAALVAEWQARLAPLDAGYAEVTPPAGLEARIAARLFPEQPKAQAPIWRGWLGGALSGFAAIAVVVLALTFWQEGPAPLPGPSLQVSLVADEAPVGFEVRWTESSGQLSLVRVAGAPAAEGQDYQLWRIGADGVPRSLGLLQTAEVALVVPDLVEGETLAVSLEPAGGSPLPTPTGPVLLAAQLERVG